MGSKAVGAVSFLRFRRSGPSFREWGGDADQGGRRKACGAAGVPCSPVSYRHSPPALGPASLSLNVSLVPDGPRTRVLRYRLRAGADWWTPPLNVR